MAYKILRKLKDGLCSEEPRVTKARSGGPEHPISECDGPAQGNRRETESRRAGATIATPSQPCRLTFPSQKADASRTKGNSEQAEQLLATVFPPLPENIDDEGDRLQRTAVAVPELTVEEMKCWLRQTKLWKAAGEDVSAGVWRQLQSAVRENVRCLLQTSLDTKPCLSSGGSQRLFH